MGVLWEFYGGQGLGFRVRVEGLGFRGLFHVGMLKDVENSIRVLGNINSFYRCEDSQGRILEMLHFLHYRWFFWEKLDIGVQVVSCSKP